MGFLSLFLIMLILVQRGKGGGLTGALGGPGGQSAFGSKAGDTFTVITIVVASIWGFTCAFTMWLLGSHTTTITDTDTTSLSAGPGDEDTETPPPIDPLSSSSGILDNLDLGGGSDSLSSGTPSADLVPADSGATTDANASGDAETSGDTDAGGDSEASSDSASEAPADDSSPSNEGAADASSSDDGNQTSDNN